MRRDARLEFWVGMFVVIGLAAIVFLALRVGTFSGAAIENPYRVEARFDHIGGLKVRAPVTLSGVRVGRVSGIGYDTRGFQAIVTLELDGHYNQLPKDTGASILTLGLLGEQYVALEPGGVEETLKSGDTLGVTQSALVLEKVISQFLYSMASKPAAETAGKP